MDKIVVISLILAIRMMQVQEKRPQEVFIYLFIPMLLFIPVHYDTKVVPGIPELSFWSAALLPAFGVWAFRDQMEGYKFTFLDLLICTHLIFVFLSQASNAGYKPGQKLFFNEVTARLLPYLMVKAIFLNYEDRIKLLKVIVVCSGIVGFFNSLEFRLWFNIFDDPFRKIWPHSVPYGNPMKRGGFRRAAGSLSHPICAGYFFVMVAPIAIWLVKLKLFVNKRIGLFLALFCILGIYVSISRAPMMGMVLTVAILSFGWTKYRIIVGTVYSIIFIILCFTVVPKFYAYINVTRAEAVTEDQRNAAYRTELLSEYKPIIAEKPLLGWGRFGVPTVKGLDSVDNEYLCIQLQHGRLALYPYVACILWSLIRVCSFLVGTKYDDPDAMLAWGLLGGLIGAAFTQTTVYAGTQTVQVFYMLFGMVEGLHLARESQTAPQYNFNRVVTGPANAHNFSRTL
jgi:hypothetical protein